MHKVRYFACLGLFFGWLLLAAFNAAAGDWPQYRGPTHDAVSTERINKNWTGSVTNSVWLVPLTNGLTGLTASGGRVFTQVAIDSDEDGFPDREFCVALSATNGNILWSMEVEAQSFPLYPDGGVGSTDDGPRTTPAVDGGSVYVLTSYLKLHRLNATNGAVIWSTNLVDGFGANVIPWQNAASPLLENGLIFLNASCGTASLMAFNATNGALVWRSQNEGLTHSTPVLATIHGVRQLIFATASGVVSLNPQTGARIWKHPFPFSYSISIGTSPIVCDDYIYLSAYYGMGAFAIQIVSSNSVQTPVQRWSNSGMQNHWVSPVCWQGTVIGMFTPDNADAQLRCVDVATGVTRWAANGFGRGSVLLVGSNLVVITERGDLVQVAANTNAYTELGRFKAIPGFHTDFNKCWNAMALSDGQLYVRSTAYAARFDLAVPDLIIDPPQLVTRNEVGFVLHTVTGDPISSNRLSGIELRASTNAGLSPASWPKLSADSFLSNGVAHLTTPDVRMPQLFFMASEPLTNLPLPRLTLGPPRFATQTKVSLVIRTVGGNSISSNRLAGMELRASTNAGLPPALWPRLNNPLTLSNGLVRVTNIDGSTPQQFFIVSEPQ